ncbi:MAG: hypothetical protein ACXWV5_00750 [Flavitalea sp.]
MFKNPWIPTSVVTVYLLIYNALFFTGASSTVIASMFILSPFLVIWMAMNILRDKKYKVRELHEDEEWGYADKLSEELS